MLGLILGLLVLWAVLTIIGLAVKAFFWLAIIGGILFAGTFLIGLLMHLLPNRGP